MSLAVALIKSVFLEFFRSVLYFPIWWYSVGLKKRLLNFIHSVNRLSYNLALRIMFKYLFKPMFGERSKSGRIISFFMRLILLIWRLFLFLIGLFFILLWLIIWISAPIIAVWQIILILFK